MNIEDYTAWCDTHLPDLFDPGLFDDEETTEETMDVVQQQFQETVLDLMDVEDTTAEEREAMTDTALEAAEAWFKAQKAAIIASIEPLPVPLLKQITTREQVAQHSADWYNQRRNRLTASEFAQILDGRRGALLRQKIAPASEAADSYGSTVALAQEDGAMTPFSWGHRFEPIVRAIYEQEIAGPTSVNDSLGRFSHRSIPYLSASPDGIVMTGALAGRLLEIKAPKSRQPGSFVPYEYYVQMQIQMEVTDLEAVDFIEAKFQQRHVGALSAEDEVALANAAWKGRIQVVTKDGILRYIYSPPTEDLDDATLKVSQEGEELLEDSIWWLVALYPRTVLRNPEWWSSTGQPAATTFWADVESGRAKAADTIELVPPSPKWRGSTSKVLHIPEL